MNKYSSSRLIFLLIGIILVLLGVYFIRTISYDGKFLKFTDYQVWGIKKVKIFVSEKNKISFVKIAGGSYGSSYSTYSSWVELSNGRKEQLLRANSEKRVSRVRNELKNCLQTGNKFKMHTFPFRISSYAGLAVIFLALFARLDKKPVK